MDLFIPFPFLNNRNGTVHSRSRSQTLKRRSLSPLVTVPTFLEDRDAWAMGLQPSLNLCNGVEVPNLLAIVEIHIWEWVEAINFVRSSTGSLVTHITIAPGKTQIQIFLPPCTDCTYFNVNISRRLTSHSVSLLQYLGKHWDCRISVPLKSCLKVAQLRICWNMNAYSSRSIVGRSTMPTPACAPSWPPLHADCMPWHQDT